VPLEAGKTEAFGNDTLAGESRIAVDQTAAEPYALGRIAKLVLLGADLSEDHRIDDFEVRWVGRQRQVNLVAIKLAVGRRPEVVFHVARAFNIVGLERSALELVEDRAVRLAHHVGQHVQPAAVGHADDDFADAELAAALDDLLERRNHRLAAIEAEALGAGVFDVGELLEGLGFDQLVEDRLLALDGEAMSFSSPSIRS
jgi:hypothetical protein